MSFSDSIILIATATSATDAITSQFIQSLRVVMVALGAFVCLAGFAVGVMRYNKSGDSSDIILMIIRLAIVVFLVGNLQYWIPPLQKCIADAAKLDNEQIRTQMKTFKSQVSTNLTNAKKTQDSQISNTGIISVNTSAGQAVDKTNLDATLLIILDKVMWLGDIVRIVFRVLQGFILKMMLGIAPFTVSGLMLPVLNNMANKYFLTLLGVLCIPLSFAIADAALVEFWGLIVTNGLIAGVATSVGALGLLTNPAGWLIVLISALAMSGTMCTITIGLYISAPAILIALMRGDNPASAMMGAFTTAAALQRSGENIGKGAMEAGAAGAGTLSGFAKSLAGPISGALGAHMGGGGSSFSSSVSPPQAPAFSNGTNKNSGAAGNTVNTGNPETKGPAGNISEATNASSTVGTTDHTANTETANQSQGTNGSNQGAGPSHGSISGFAGNVASNANSGLNQFTQAVVSSAGASLGDSTSNSAPATTIGAGAPVNQITNKPAMNTDKLKKAMEDLYQRTNQRNTKEEK